MPSSTTSAIPDDQSSTISPASSSQSPPVSFRVSLASSSFFPACFFHFFDFLPSSLRVFSPVWGAMKSAIPAPKRAPSENAIMKSARPASRAAIVSPPVSPSDAASVSKSAFMLEEPRDRLAGGGQRRYRAQKWPLDLFLHDLHQGREVVDAAAHVLDRGADALGLPAGGGGHLLNVPRDLLRLEQYGVDLHANLVECPLSPPDRPLDVQRDRD